MSGKKQRKAIEIANSIRSTNNLPQFNAYSDYWSPLADLVEEPDDNTFDDFSHMLQNKYPAGKPDAKSKSPPYPT